MFVKEVDDWHGREARLLLSTSLPADQSIAVENPKGGCDPSELESLGSSRAPCTPSHADARYDEAPANNGIGGVNVGAVFVTAVVVSATAGFAKSDPCKAPFK